MRWLEQVREWLSKASPADQFSVGRSYAREGRFSDAARVFAPLLDLHPGVFGRTPGEYADMMCEIGRCAFELGKYDEADGIFRRGLTDFGATPNAPALWVELGRCAMAQGKTDQMREHLDAAWRIQREHGANVDEPAEFDLSRVPGERVPADHLAELAAEIARVLTEAGDERGAVRYWRRARLRYERTRKIARMSWALRPQLTTPHPPPPVRA